MKILSLGMLMLSVSFSTPYAYGQASNVKAYVFPSPLPDVTTTAFFTARDKVMEGLATVGHPISTASRVGDPSRIEIRNVIEANDMCVSSTLFLHRGVINPPAPYSTMRGERYYGPVLYVAEGGQISLDRVSYSVICEITNYSNESTLTGLGYSGTRRGISVGPDGQAFTADDVIKTSGPAGDLEDMIAFIGGRVGAEVSSQGDINSLNAAIASLPNRCMSVVFEYRYILTSGRVVTNRFGTLVYPDGMIPPTYNRIVPFKAPNGYLFSVVGPPHSAPMRLEMSHALNTWTVVDAAATEGISVFSPFTSTEAYFKLRPSSQP